MSPHQQRCYHSRQWQLPIKAFVSCGHYNENEEIATILQIDASVTPNIAKIQWETWNLVDEVEMNRVRFLDDMKRRNRKVTSRWHVDHGSNNDDNNKKNNTATANNSSNNNNSSSSSKNVRNDNIENEKKNNLEVSSAPTLVLSPFWRTAIKPSLPQLSALTRPPFA